MVFDHPSRYAPGHSAFARNDVLTSFELLFDVTRPSQHQVLGTGVETKYRHSHSHEPCRSHCHCHADDYYPECCAYIHLSQRHQTRDGYSICYHNSLTLAARVTNTDERDDDGDLDTIYILTALNHELACEVVACRNGRM